MGCTYNGDGTDDLAIGNPHDPPRRRAHAGSVHVLFGTFHRRWSRFVDTARGELVSRSRVKIGYVMGARGDVPDSNGGPRPIDSGDTLGYSAAAGDIDGDGRDNLITKETVGNGVAPNTIDVGNLIVIGGDLVSAG